MSLPAAPLVIVDDDAVERARLRRALAPAFPGETRLVEAELGAEGLALCQATPPLCLLLAVELPDMTGLDLLAALCDGRDAPACPIVVLLAPGGEPLVLQALQRGAQDYLVKGRATDDERRRTVRNAIEKWRLQQEVAEQQRALVAQVARARAASCAAKQARRRAEIVAEVSQVLASSLDDLSILQGVTRLLAGELGDTCVLATVDQHRQIETLAVAHREPGGETRLRETLQGTASQAEQVGAPPTPVERWPMLRPYITGWPELYPDLHAVLPTSIQRPALRLALEELGLSCGLGVPLQTCGRIIGALWLGAEQPQRYDQDDLRLAEEIGRQVAVAVENLRLYRALHSTNSLLEQRIAERTAALQTINAQLQRELAERQSIEAALRESQERFRRAFDDAAIGMALVGLDGRFIQVNQAICELTGYAAPELLALSFQQITHPDDLDIDLSHARQLIDGTIRTYQLEKRYIHKAGHVVWVLLNGSLVRDPHGRPHYFIAQVEDISQRKQAEAALLQSEAQLQAIFDNSPAAMFVKDRAGRYLLVNRQCERLFRGAEVIGKDESELLGPELAARMRANDQQVLASGRAQQFEETVPLDDGPHTYISIKFPLVGPTGQPYAVCGIATDITERQRTAAALAESQRLIQSIARATPNLIYVYDLPTRRTVYSNRAAGALLGYSADDPPAREPDTLEILPHLADQPGPADGLAQLLAARDGDVIESEYRVRHADGSWRWLLSRDTVFSRAADGTPQQILGTAQDITARKQAEERMATTLREKDVLLMEIHHRVKNNLQVIASMLKLQTAYLDDPRTLELFRESQHRVRSMALVHEKLYQTADLTCIDFVDYVRNLANFLLRSYGVRGSSLHVDHTGLPVLLNIEQAVPLGLIVNELVSNALKHAFPGGALGQIRVEICPEADQLTLVVHDNGVGMPEGLDFGAAPSLGLRLVSSLVKQLRATIKRRPGPGTTLVLSLSTVTCD